MGPISLPPTGPVYVDADALIYMVEAHPVYAPVLTPVWVAARSGRFRVVTSHLTLMEALVGPLKRGDAAMVAAFEALFRSPDVTFLAIDEDVLREAARIRAARSAIRTPDALHAATAIRHGATLFLTNDPGFRRVPGLPVDLLSEHLTP